MLNISHLTYRIANRPILEDANLSVMGGWKLGVVGQNGAGKSTLFKLITGELVGDGGDIEMNSRNTIGYIRQDLPDGNITLMDVVLAADKERADLMARSETEEDPYKLAEIHTRLNDIEAYTAPARAASILSGMGFTDEQIKGSMSALSGGWKMRVALGAALFQQPDLLLLDEPTNHLDLEAIMWLENYLANYPNTLMMISHDRDLLNKCTDHIAHIEHKGMTLYTGNYDDFERERAQKRGLQQKMYEKQQAERDKMLKFIERFRANANKAKQAQSRIKALERMDMVNAVAAERSVTFSFPQPDELPPPVISIANASLGYGNDEPVLKNIDARIDMDDRIALLGANGNGKSTLIKAIAGKLKPKFGSVHQANKVRIGYFSQHQTDELDVNSTPFIEMSRLMKGNAEAGVRSKLGRFGFNKTLQDNRIGDLSGGEKARLLFALISYNAPHVLLLDEPTNHLDIDAREALVKALNSYEGAVVIVSHDPSMVERVADRLWLVQDGKVQAFDGDLESYRQLIIEQRRQEKKSKKPNKGPSKKELREQAAARRKQFAPIYKKVEEAEKELSRLNKKKKELETQMAQPDFYDDSEAVQDAQFAYGQLMRDIEQAEAEWLNAQEAFDKAQ